MPLTKAQRRALDQVVTPQGAVSWATNGRSDHQLFDSRTAIDRAIVCIWRHALKPRAHPKRTPQDRVTIVIGLEQGHAYFPIPITALEYQALDAKLAEIINYLDRHQITAPQIIKKLPGAPQ